MTTILAAVTVLFVIASTAFAADAPTGAAACSGCHAIRQGVDSPVPRLNGRDAAQIVAAMAEFRAGQRPATVMGLVAKGFSDEETRAIAAWYAAQKE
jgi:cytochrome c553